MKVGDLVRWDKDDDIGLVLGFVVDKRRSTVGNPIIHWMNLGYRDDAVNINHKLLEVISELAQPEAR
jgi:uncharacterized protein YijF (DUF1287 family)